MIEKILLYIEKDIESRKVIDFALTLAVKFRARIIALFVTEKEDQEHEEEAWSYLYKIEDKAFEEEVKASLVLEHGDPEERILSLGRSFEADLIMISADTSLNLPQLIEESPITITIVK